MNLFQYLTQLREDVPSWLSDFKPGDPFPRQQFFHLASFITRARALMAMRLRSLAQHMQRTVLFMPIMVSPKPY